MFSSFLVPFQSAHPLVFVGLLLLLSHAAGLLAHRLHSPKVTGYLVVGMLASPSVTGLLSATVVEERLGLITDIALGAIAFSIGGVLRWKQLKKLGLQIATVTLAEGFGAMLFPFLAVVAAYGLGQVVDPSLDWRTELLPLAIMIGALCVSTAPAATLAVIHEVRADGPLTQLLLGVVAIDDALGITAFALAKTGVLALVGVGVVSWGASLGFIGREIGLALLLGGVLGWAMALVARHFSPGLGLFGVAWGALFLCAGLAHSLGASPLLANMTLGFVLVNFLQHHQDLFAVVEEIEEPIFGMFFLLAGAHLDLSVLPQAGALAVLILLARFLGKLLGAGLGAKVSGSPPQVVKYLGLGLTPQAGVAVGLVLSAKASLPAGPVGSLLVNGILATVVLNELISPFFIRFALNLAGEAGQRGSKGGEDE
ncbi:MAG: cation:proton antiporter [bacterium]|nr:cation:proton antiporter [bacterium]